MGQFSRQMLNKWLSGGEDESKINGDKYTCRWSFMGI